MALCQALSEQLEASKLVLKTLRHGSSNLREAIVKLERSADRAAITQLQRRMAPVYKKAPTSAAKYAKPRHWLLLNSLRAADLGLDKTGALRVLDIGCGPGFFVAMARALGHDCHGVDAPDSYLTAVERDVYTTLTEAFRCRSVVKPLLIERFQPMPFHDQPFDLITAFWICFNRHRQADEWGMEEWRFFVEDARACLRGRGRLVLDLNEHRERYGDLAFYDAATADYFHSQGTVEQGRVVITRS
jgi:SAM-dependent methyltransferase